MRFVSAIPLALSALFTRAAAQACPPLPASLPAPSDFPIIPALPDPFTFRLSGAKVQSVADFACRKRELLALVQEYFYGFYPDHARERVSAVRAGPNLTITVAVDGKSASFPATLAFPPNVSVSPAHRVPVVLSPGLIDDNAFLASGVAIATFDVNTVAVDSTARTGAFWTLYGDRDIGACGAFARGGALTRFGQAR